jgi:exosome complex component CSL4
LGIFLELYHLPNRTTNNYNHKTEKHNMSETSTLPGDKIASIEEYEAGHNTFDDGDMVRASTVGEKNLDKSTRVASIKNPKLLSIPQVGDTIIGTVAAVMSSMIAVSIDYINGKPTTSKVECVCGTRNLRKKNVALVNDIVTLKILNHLNGTIHAKIDEPQLGVLFTKCRKCGGKVVQMRDAIKCTECSWIDERKLSTDFGKSDFIHLRE